VLGFYLRIDDTKTSYAHRSPLFLVSHSGYHSVGNQYLQGQCEVRAFT